VVEMSDKTNEERLIETIAGIYLIIDGLMSFGIAVFFPPMALIAWLPLLLGAGLLYYTRK